LRENGFKVPLARNVIVQTLLDLTEADDDIPMHAMGRPLDALTAPLK